MKTNRKNETILNDYLRKHAEMDNRAKIKMWRGGGGNLNTKRIPSEYWNARAAFKKSSPQIPEMMQKINK